MYIAFCLYCDKMMGIVGGRDKNVVFCVKKKQQIFFGKKKVGDLIRNTVVN